MKYSFEKSQQHWRALGRNALENGILKCEFTASGFETEIDAVGDVILEFEMKGIAGMFAVIVNNDYGHMQTYYFQPGKHRAIIATLTEKSVVRVVKLTEYSRMQLDLIGIEFDGKFGKCPDSKALKFDFYGDSLTCGYGNLSTNRNSPDPFGALEHGYLTWAALLAREYDADFNCICCSGQGFISDCGGNKEGIIDKYRDYALPSKGVLWDYSKYVADYVFINFGTNDINWCKNSNTPLDTDLLYSKAEALTDNIRRHYPDCNIIWALGFDSSNPYFTQMVDTYKKIAEKDGRMYVIDCLTCNQLGGDWHPNLDDHKLIFEKLKKELEKLNIGL
ncbi:MAG: GDSL-type esterase/lipase family protein [Acutalibacteraceae bacterium]|nr:GDSL-type esterase/lipase family protein [Acutalibacteraceae bacterium]